MTDKTTKIFDPDGLPVPTIAAVIPLYNGARYIEEALRGVLAQTLPPHEIIVVDDGSTDDGPAIVERMAADHPITLLRKPNGGQSSARNLGIQHANSELIALLDQDDVWYANHLEKLVEPFLEVRRVELGWVYANLDEIDINGRLIGVSVLDACSTPHPKDTLITCLREDMYILPSSTLISRKAFLAIGGFDEELSGYEDDDLFIRLFHAGYDHAYIRTPLGRWRIYKASSSRSPRMARSRMVFARKLLRNFPDDPFNHRHYSRDLIAPRFLRQAIVEAREALRKGNPEAIERCLTDVALLRSHLPNRHGSGARRHEYLITAIIPLYNGATFIEETLQSVLAQTMPPDEIIVVDDGSSDAGPEIVRRLAQSHPIRLLQKENGGQSSARNFGVAHAHGDLIAFLDHDDIWYPHHLATLMEPFAGSRPTDLGWTYSNLDRVDQEGRPEIRSFLSTLKAVHPKKSLLDCLAQDLYILPSAALIARQAFLAVGGFDESLSGYEDDDLFLRLFQAGFEHIYIDEALSAWRIFPRSASYSPRMVASRRFYAQKLLKRFPDNRQLQQYYASTVIAPRFLHQAIAEAREALKLDDRTVIATCLADIAMLREHTATKSGRLTARRHEYLITAIIPLYNGAAFIEETLQSVLAQTMPPDEIIVVDDGSSDEGPEIVRRLAQSHPIRLLQKENGGQSAARNFGVAHAHGDLIAFLDHDDIWYPHHLATLMEPFAGSRPTDLGWTYSNLDRVDQDGSMQFRSFLSDLGTAHPKTSLLDCLGQDMYILPSAALIDRKAFLAVGGFDESLSGYEDDDLFLRLFRAGYDNVYLDEALSRWRIFPSSASYSPRMAKSRRIYAEKLLSQFPDNLRLAQYHSSHVIAPRFLAQMAAEYRKAINYGTPEESAMAFRDVRFIIGHLRRRLRLPLTLVMPLLSVRPLARVMFGLRGLVKRWV